MIKIEINKNKIYRLTKVAGKNKNSGVQPGQFAEGPGRVLEAGKDRYCVLVRDTLGTGDLTFIRTSQVIKIIEKKVNVILFETIGGFYSLEEIKP